MRPIVAVIITNRTLTTRTYTAFSQTYQPLESVTVYDHGHGASLAHTHFQIHYRLSSADWTHRIAHLYRHRESHESLTQQPFATPPIHHYFLACIETQPDIPV